MSISTENKAVNMTLRDVLNGVPNYSTFADDEEKNTIDILSCIDSPRIGVTSYGTLGLSDYDMGKEVDSTPLGVEFVGACYSRFDAFSNVLATCAFYIINSNYKCEPGSIFNEIINLYMESQMKHVMFVTPFTWEKELKTLFLKPKKVVAWLQLIPISDAEMAYSTVNGKGALEKVLEKERVYRFSC